MTVKRVLVLGGGVGGLTAAHELSEPGREFQVTVLERQSILGGKARSLDVPDTAIGGSQALPAEHGFRFFPGFYQHLDDTMARIPMPDGGPNETVFDQLVKVHAFAIARGDGNIIELPTQLAVDFDAVRTLLGSLGTWNVKIGNIWFFMRQLAWLLAMPRPERRARLDGVSWWEFTEADSRGADDPEYLRYFVDGITRSMVACRAKEMNAYTAGTIFLQLMRSVVFDDPASDRVLTGPTNERWIDPWVTQLTARGVDIRTGVHVESLDTENGRITGAHVRGADGVDRIEADWYVAALPVERMVELVDADLGRADPGLLSLSRLKTQWMNGVLLYLAEPLDLCRGHVIYSQAPWALTSVEQQHHWTDPMRVFGNGSVGGILSVDVSDWDAPGIVHRKPARECTRDEICDEVRAQIQRHVPPELVVRLDDGNVLDAYVDPAIIEGRAGHTNDEPLLVNTTGSWACRPEAQTALPNLVLAADYVRTNTNLACMEGANEAARRAVNVMLTDAGVPERRQCAVFDLVEFFGEGNSFGSQRLSCEAGAAVLTPDELPMDWYAPLDDTGEVLPFVE